MVSVELCPNAELTSPIEGFIISSFDVIDKMNKYHDVSWTPPVASHTRCGTRWKAVAMMHEILQVASAVAKGGRCAGEGCKLGRGHCKLSLEEQRRWTTQISASRHECSITCCTSPQRLVRLWSPSCCLAMEVTAPHHGPYDFSCRRSHHGSLERASVVLSTDARLHWLCFALSFLFCCVSPSNKCHTVNSELPWFQEEFGGYHLLVDS